jgi:integrase
LQDKGYKPSSIRQIHTAAKAGFKFAAKLGRVKANPAEGAELPPLNKPKKARVFDEEEALRFIEASWRERKCLIFIFGLLTGMRPSEFFGVQYTDLSLESGVVDGQAVERALAHVRRAVVRSGGGWYFSEPKTKAGRRSVYFPAVIYHELMAQRAEHLEELKRLGQPHQLVFTNTLGGPLNRSSLTRNFFAACRRAGVSFEGRSLYTLRRSHATLSLLTGENLKSLSERLGHKSVEFTQDEYVDTLPVMQHMVADRLETKLLRTQLAPPECVRTM